MTQSKGAAKNNIENNNIRNNNTENNNTENRNTENKTTENKKRQATPDDMTIINELISAMYQDMQNQEGRFKVMELLRALEFKRKIAPPDDREGEFWNMIDEIRTRELNHNGNIPTEEVPSSRSGTVSGKETKRKVLRK